MSAREYEKALAAVTAAARIYCGGVTDPIAGVDQGSVWSPIYTQLLAEFEAQLRAAGAQYDQVADENHILPADRFDWRGYLRSE